MSSNIYYNQALGALSNISNYELYHLLPIIYYLLFIAYCLLSFYLSFYLPITSNNDVDIT